MSTSGLRIRRWGLCLPSAYLGAGRGASPLSSLCLASICLASAALAGLPGEARADTGAPSPADGASAAQPLAAPRQQRQTLSAEQAVSLAGKNNPTLRAALLDAAAARHAVDAERGARDPNLVASLQVEHSETLTRGASTVDTTADDPSALIDGSSREIQNRLSSKVGVSYTTNIGTQLEVGTSAGASWNETSPVGLGALPSHLNLGPSYSADAYLSARQPLLRGAGSDVELSPLRQAQSSARAAQARQELAASQTALDVLEAYWALWYADRAVEVQEQAAHVAQRLVSDAELRARTLGTGAEVDVLQFSTSAASIADALSRARAERTTRAIELGRLLGVAPDAAASLAAEGAAPELRAAPELDARLADVTAASPELAALRSEIERAEARAAVARDADQPRLDLFATASLGTLWDHSSGFSLSGGQPAFGVLGGIEFALPLGPGRAPGDAAVASDELSAARARYQARALALAAQASSLSVNLTAAAEQVELTRATAGMATRLAEAERQRLLLGTTSAQNVVTAEQTSREAELRRLQALVSQASARFELEHTTGTLLDRFATL